MQYRITTLHGCSHTVWIADIPGEHVELAFDIVTAMVQVAFLVAVAMCLVFCWYLLRRLGADNDEAALRDLLLQEMVSDQPILLAPPTATPPAITSQPARAIPAEKQ